jgi:signal transduction histidine kinase
MGVYGPVNDDQRVALARVEHAQGHLLGLINDVLNFAKVESGRIEFDLRVLDVAAIVADVAPLMAPQFAARGVDFVTRIDEGDDGPLRVCADGDKVRQILLNLLSNAAKFTGAGGRVAVECVPEAPDRVALRVRDTGCGIPADRLESIFEPFVQVRPPYGSPHDGTGLGLAISRDLARGMQGDLVAESREGEGSTFTLCLARAPQGAHVD